MKDMWETALARFPTYLVVMFTDKIKNWMSEPFSGVDIPLPMSYHFSGNAEARGGVSLALMPYLLGGRNIRISQMTALSGLLCFLS